MPVRLPSPRELLSNLTNLKGNKYRRSGFGGGPPTGKVFEKDDDDAKQQHQLPRTRSRVNLHASHKKQHVGPLLSSPFRKSKSKNKGAYLNGVSTPPRPWLGLRKARTGCC